MITSKTKVIMLVAEGSEIQAGTAFMECCMIGRMETLRVRREKEIVKARAGKISIEISVSRYQIQKRSFCHM